MAKLSLGLGKNAPKAKDSPVETQETLYQKACAKMQAVPVILQNTYKKENYELAAQMFEQLGDYLDSPQLAEECRQKAEETDRDIRREQYDRLERKIRGAEQAAKDGWRAARAYRISETEWKDAVQELQSMGEYREAPALAAAAQKGYAGAVKRLKRKRNILVGALAVVLIGATAGTATGYFRYLYGCAFMEVSAYGQARNHFLKLGTFLDSEEKALECEYLAIQNTAEGSSVPFGGRTWRVLEKTDGQARLMMTTPEEEDPLYAIAFNEAGGETDWESSSLRAYLNGAFLEGFAEAELAYMLAQPGSESVNDTYGTLYEESGEDLVTILSAGDLSSLGEIVQDENHTAEDNAAAAADIADPYESSYADLISSLHLDFWLRTPGSSYERAAFRLAYGQVAEDGMPVDTAAIAALPVITVDYEEALTQM